MGGSLLVLAMVAGAQAQTRGGFDGVGHLMLHGTPRFVLGVYDSGGGYSPDPAFWENQIFSPSGSRGLQGFALDVYLNYYLGGMPIDSTDALLDVLQNHGMMYLQTGNCFGSGSWLRYGATAFSISSQTYVQQFAQHPAALGYYIMDECDDSLIPETEQHHQQLLTWDPQGISLATNIAAAYRDPSLWVNAAEIMAIDPYPLYGTEPSQGYPHFMVADFTAKLRWIARPDRPTWSVVQFFKFTTDSRMPTEAEMRAHAVMSIVEGAQGVFWWDIGVNGLRALDSTTVSTYMAYLKTLTTELAGLEPALVAPSADGALVGNTTRFSDAVQGRIQQLQHNIAVETVYSRVQADQAEIAALQAGDTSISPLLPGAANVRTLSKIVGGVGYVFAYNYTNLQQPVTFTWQQAPTKVKESKTGQSYALSGASWQDSFGPYEARIYVLTGAGSPPGPSLAVVPTNVTAGKDVTATWSGIASPTTMDWIGLYAQGAANSAYLAWVYVSCSQVSTSPRPSGSCVMTIPGGLAPGTYELRLFANNGYTRLASSGPLTATAAAAFDYSLGNSGPISMTRGSSGSTTIAATLQSGTTQAVTFSASGLPSGATAAFSPGTCSPTCSTVLTISTTGSTPTGTFPITVTGSPLNRTTTFNLVVTAAATLSVSPTSVAPGGTVTATWSGIPSPTTTDWIGLFVPGAPNTSYVTWIYVSCSQTPSGAAAAGSCPFAIPGALASGTYELRLFSNNGYTRLATSNTFTVTAGGGDPSLSASPSTVPAGGSVTVSWSGIVSPTSTDWIGLYASGSANTAYLAWIYVSCSHAPGAAVAAGSCAFTIPSSVTPGTYELRLLANNGYTRLATSNALTVTTAGPGLSASPPTVVHGSSVTATWSAIPSPTTTDWIGLFAPGAANTAYIAWIYVSCSRTPGAAMAAGSCPFTIPSSVTPGPYELRLFSANGYTRLATSNPLTVN